MMGVLRRLRARLRYRSFERDLQREMEVHRAMKQEALEASGLSGDAARAAAARSLGNVVYMREEARSVWIAMWLEQASQDLRYALRGLRRQPGFSAAAILILALGVSSLTVAYSTMNATLLRPWPVPGAESVVIVRARPAPQQQYGVLSVDEVLYLNAHARTLAGLTTLIRAGEQIDGTGPSVQSNYVTSNYFAVMRVGVMSGPGFTPGRDDVPSTKEVVLSERLWRDHFGSDPAIAGRVIRLSSQSFTVVGVAEQGFEDVSSNRIDLWISLSALDFGGANRPGGMAVGRLAEGTSRTKALAELEVLSRQFRDSQRIPAFGLTLTDTRPISTGQPGAGRQFAMVFSGLGLILLLTCANVGSLLLARALARQREAALRLSLGASSWRVARQSLTETLVLALGAGVLGVALAAAWPTVLRTISGNIMMRQNYLAPDWSVVAFAIAASSVAAGLAGFSAAHRIARMHPLQVSAQRHGPDRESRKARSILLAAQVAVTAVFLTSAGLLGRAVVVTAGSDPGFAVDGISLVSVEFREPLLPAQRNAFTRALGAVVSDAGRDDVAFAAFRPLIKGASTVIRVYRPAEEPSLARYITHRPVSANYFALMRIPIVEGRAPMAGTEGREVVVNEMLARTLWPGESAVGKTLKELGAKDSPDLTVVGVARDVPIRALGQFEPVVYSTSASLALALVSTANPEAMEYLRRASRALEPSAVLVATPLRQIVRESASDIENASVVGWLVGAAALFISTLGIFGVFAYAVEERRREIGIRIALGGRASHVRLEVLRSGQQAAALGTGIGFALCLIVASLLQHQLYGLQPLHAFTYIQVAAILGAAVLMALWIPAWRATRVDPAVTLRCD